MKAEGSRSSGRPGRGVAALAAALALMAAGCVATPERPLTSLAPMIAAANEVTVGVFAGEIAEPGPLPNVPPNIGTGFYVHRSGVIATAAHIVAGLKDVAVRYNDGGVERASVIGIDDPRDVALLKVARTVDVLPLFGSGEHLRVGDWVIALGEPYGMGRSASAGIVGSVDRHFAEDEDLLFIQTDVSVNPGNSGGPLLDAQGRVVAMAVRVLTGSFGMTGLSLSIPIEEVLKSTRVIMAHEPPPLPPIGAEFEDLTPLEMLAMGAQVRGALVVDVHPDSVAESAGLRRGDLIVALGDARIVDSLSLSRLLAARHATQPTRLSVLRSHRVLTLLIEPARGSSLASGTARGVGWSVLDAHQRPPGSALLASKTSRLQQARLPSSSTQQGARP